MKLAIVLLAVALAGCCVEDDGRRCVKSHEEVVFYPMYNGTGFTLMPIWHTVCDEEIILPVEERKQCSKKG